MDDVYDIFLMLKHWFCWKYQYIKFMFIFIDIYSFIPVSGRVGMGPSALLCPVAYDAVKTALTVMNIDLLHNTCQIYQILSSAAV